jgi:hypothetical protein
MSLFLSLHNKHVGIILSDMADRATEDTDKTLSKTKQNNHSQSCLENGHKFRNQPEM